MEEAGDSRREKNMDGELERSYVGRWKGVAVGMKWEKVETGGVFDLSLVCSLSLFVFCFGFLESVLV